MSTPLSAELLEKIRIKAYLLWEKAGGPGGDGHQFWVEAEKVIVRMAKLTEAKKAKAKPVEKLAPAPKAKVKAKAKAKPVTDPVVAVADDKTDKKKKKKKSDKKKSEKKKEKK